MTAHELAPSADSVADVLTCERDPVLTVRPGDRITVRTLDCSGNLHRAERLVDRHELIPDARGHCLAGPIAVTGARPGQILAVRLESLTPDAWGFTASGGHDNVLNRALETAAGEPAYLVWDIEETVARNQLGISVDVRPFLGVIGMPPEVGGEHSTIPPRAAGAGNIDCRELIAGSTLFVPVTVPDAYLFVGDGHAAQGDGEVGGTAIETGMTTTFTVDVVDETPVRGVHASTPAGLVTFGFDADLNVATTDALHAMLTWMERLTGLARPVVLAVASTMVDLRITQVANRTWGVHALLPTNYAAQLTERA